jgi:hypothetical protein
MSHFRLNMKLGHFIYFVIFLLTACLRLVHLGNFPLSDDEALHSTQPTLRLSSPNLHQSLHNRLMKS